MLYPIPMQTGAYTMPQAGMGGMFVLFMIILVIVILVIPTVLFLVMLYKVRRRASDWQGIFSSDDIKRQIEQSNERVTGFTNKIDELSDLWIERERKKK